MTSKPLRTIRWKKAADDDLAAIIEYLAADSPKAAERMFEELFNAVEILPRFPFTGNIYPRFPKARQLIVGNYVLYYTVSPREIVVRAVVHGARRFRVAWLRRR
jgi:plasmid stabilization system protein ParE